MFILNNELFVNLSKMQLSTRYISIEDDMTQGNVNWLIASVS